MFGLVKVLKRNSSCRHLKVTEATLFCSKVVIIVHQISLLCLDLDAHSWCVFEFSVDCFSRVDILWKKRYVAIKKPVVTSYDFSLSCSCANDEKTHWGKCSKGMQSNDSRGLSCIKNLLSASTSPSKKTIFGTTVNSSEFWKYFSSNSSKPTKASSSSRCWLSFDSVTIFEKQILSNADKLSLSASCGQ